MQRVPSAGRGIDLFPVRDPLLEGEILGSTKFDANSRRWDPAREKRRIDGSSRWRESSDRVELSMAFDRSTVISCGIHVGQSSVS